MKRFLSLFLIILILVISVPTAFAAPGWICETCGNDLCPECEGCVSCGTCTCINTNDYSQGTQVVFEATNSESYTITVPAKLAPGGSGTVTLQGTWAVDRYVTVTASEEIDLVNSINPADKKTLAVTFDGIGKRGSNTAALTVTEQISVADIENALFGTWSGLIEYNTEIETRIVDLAGTTWKMNEEINNYEWAASGNDDNTQLVYVSCNNIYCGIYNQFYSAHGALSFHFDGTGEFTPVYLSETSAAMFTLPEAGWYLVNSNLQSSFNEGNTDVLSELINSAQKCSAPTLVYNNIKSAYLQNLDVIDWLYDNAVMQ